MVTNLGRTEYLSWSLGRWYPAQSLHCHVFQGRCPSGILLNSLTGKPGKTGRVILGSLALLENNLQWFWMKEYHTYCFFFSFFQQDREEWKKTTSCSWDSKCFFFFGLLQWTGVSRFSKEAVTNELLRILGKGYDFLWKWFSVLHTLEKFLELKGRIICYLNAYIYKVLQSPNWFFLSCKKKKKGVCGLQPFHWGGELQWDNMKGQTAITHRWHPSWIGSSI